MTEVVRLHIIHSTPHRPNLSIIVNLGPRRDESSSHGNKSLTETAFVWFNVDENTAGVAIVTTTRTTTSFGDEGNITDGPGVAPTKKEQQDIISLRRFEKQIPDEAAAITFAEEAIWQGDPRSVRSGNGNVYRVKNGRPMSHRCRDCKRHFSVRIGTVMAETNLPVRTWLLAIHLTLTARKGVSALQMHRHLGVTYPTAWFLDHRIREAMKQNKTPVMTGIIQIDETWIGGKAKNIHKSIKKQEGWTGMGNKFAVIGLRQDDGTVIIFPVPDTYAETLQNAVLDNVKPGSTIWSDEAPAYKPLLGYGYIHEWVTHGSGEYVRDMVTNNGVESFWALLKRGYIGTFHYVSWKHLHRYCDEFAYRHNAGKGNGFETIGGVLRCMVGKRVTYQQLIQKERKQGDAPKPDGE